MAITALEHEIRERYGRAAWTHKTHEKAADRYECWHVRLTWGKIILSALAASSSTWAVFLNGKAGVLTSIISILLLLINIIFENRNYETLSNDHRQAAAKMLGVREDWLSLISKLHMPNPDLMQIDKEKEVILARLKKITPSLPRTSCNDYNAATTALHEGELNFTDDQEIDHILPPAFRIATTEDSHEH